MIITCDHSASSYGVPVILDDDGQLLDYAEGVRALRALRGWSTLDMAMVAGVSRRTVEGWEQGRNPRVAALNVLAGYTGS